MAATSDKHRRYWARNLRVIAVLLAPWFLLSFGIGFAARELSFDFFGWPFGFWAAAQGALIGYVAIVAIYARVMNRLDQAHGGGDTD